MLNNSENCCKRGNCKALFSIAGSEWGGRRGGGGGGGGLVRMSVVGKSQLIFWSVVGNFFLVLSVVSNIF